MVLEILRDNLFKLTLCKRKIPEMNFYFERNESELICFKQGQGNLNEVLGLV